jgi:hypothetical protein
MQSTRKSFLRNSSLGLIIVTGINSSNIFSSENLKDISETPFIQNEERVARIKKAQKLLKQNKYDCAGVRRWHKHGIFFWNSLESFRKVYVGHHSSCLRNHLYIPIY